MTTSASPYQSGEFSFNSLDPQWFEGIPFNFTPPAAAAFDRQIWVGSVKVLAAEEQYLGLKFMTLSLFPDPKRPGTQIDIENGDAALPANWKEAIVTFPDGSAPSSQLSPGLAATSSRLFMVWNEEEVQEFPGQDPPDQPPLFRASEYWSEDGDAAPSWHAPLVLLPDAGWQMSGGPANSQTAVGVAAFGDDMILAGCANLGGQGYVGAFYVADIDYKRGVWQARSGVGFPAASGSISLDWFNGFTAPLVPTGGVNPPPPFLVWISGGPGSSGATGFNLLLNLGSNGELSGTGISWNGWGTVTRDPGGLMSVHGALASGDAVYRSVYNTAKLIRPVPSISPLQEITDLADKKTTTSDLASAPAVVYLKDASRAYAVQAGAQTGTAYPWYEFLFYSAFDDVYCQVSRYCTTEIFPSFESYTPKPRRATNMILTGIVDGPVPIPNINIANIVFNETEPTFAEVTYGFNKGAKRNTRFPPRGASG